MEKEATYTIYTDASFDQTSQIGTYSIVVMQGNTILKKVARRCTFQMKDATECEIYAVHQAINFILSIYLKKCKNKKQKFKIRTDSIVARDFYITGKINKKFFIDKMELVNEMKQRYKTACKKIEKAKSSFSISWIPREGNKVAHKWTTVAFKRLRGYSEMKEVLLINKEAFLELVSNKKQKELIEYLFAYSNDNKIIHKTQKEMANTLNITTSDINRNLKKLIDIDVLEKVKNGKYALLI